MLLKIKGNSLEATKSLKTMRLNYGYSRSGPYTRSERGRSDGNNNISRSRDDLSQLHRWPVGAVTVGKDYRAAESGESRRPRRLRSTKHSRGNAGGHRGGEAGPASLAGHSRAAPRQDPARRLPPVGGTEGRCGEVADARRGQDGLRVAGRASAQYQHPRIYRWGGPTADRRNPSLRTTPELCLHHPTATRRRRSDYALELSRGYTGLE